MCTTEIQDRIKYIQNNIYKNNMCQRVFKKILYISNNYF